MVKEMGIGKMKNNVSRDSADTFFIPEFLFLYNGKCGWIDGPQRGPWSMLRNDFTLAFFNKVHNRVGSVVHSVFGSW